MKAMLNRLKAAPGALLGDSARRAQLLDSAATFLSRACGTLLIFVISVALSRNLGAGDFGRYSFALSFNYMLVILVTLGLPVAGMKITARYLARGRTGMAVHFLLFAAVLVVAMAAAVGLAVSTIQPWLPEAYRQPTGLTVLMLASIGLMRLLADTARGVGQPLQGNLYENVYSRLMILAGVLWLVVTGRLDGVEGPILLYAGANLISGIGLLVHLLRTLRARPAALPGGHGRGVGRGRVRIYRGWVGVSTVMMLTPVFFFVMAETDIILIGLFSTDEQVGLYQVARRIAELTTFCTLIANVAALPRFASLHAKGDLRGMQAVVDTANILALVPAALVCASILAFGVPVLGVFGPEFTAGYALCVLMALTRLVDSLLGPAGEILMMTGHHTRTMRVNLLFGALNIALNALLVPRFGATGAAAATAVSLVGWKLWTYWLVRRHVPVEPCLLLRLPRRTRVARPPLGARP
ncbi:oligosaccharide flippase family protein [Azospirillum rugosum]|uniref:O-antigen/teichoic acid export membrane protein n=1 Tax=Azospirillum rugosum TaxID=416170 RepID=A0ABS4SLL1_9PROT|nr:oligosaccharide flippase family protein [Azospirillum rugosum]MBP2293367.1 O-antigen/teichoic acid export membrane protein [Azospirillum rugosum]